MCGEKNGGASKKVVHLHHWRFFEKLLMTENITATAGTFSPPLSNTHTDEEVTSTQWSPL